MFYTSEPMSVLQLSKICEVSEGEITQAVLNLETQLTGRGISLVHEGTTIGLMTSAAASDLIEKIRKEELKRDIGKAGAETLAIIAYNESVTRAEIDFIRGVNSTFILRNLLMRGLIERIPNPQDQRSFAYKPTLELYAHLGITKKEELPQYHEMVEEIQKYKAETKIKNTDEEQT